MARLTLSPTSIAVVKAKTAYLEALKAHDAAKPEEGSSFASDTEIDAAREALGSDELEIDDGALASRTEGEGGKWIQAWVWLADSDEDTE